MRMPKSLLRSPRLALLQPLHAVVPAWEKEAPETVADLLAIQKQVQKVLPKCMAATVTLQMGGSSGSGGFGQQGGLGADGWSRFRQTWPGRKNHSRRRPRAQG